MKNYFQNLFKRKCRYEVAEIKASAMVNDIFTSDFSTKEIALICDLFTAEILTKLESERKNLINELHDVTLAIDEIKK
jgi:hypothetical protein